MPAADADEDQDDGIGQQVGERVDGVGHHRSTSAEDAGDEFESCQQQVNPAADKRHLIDSFFPVHKMARAMRAQASASAKAW